MNIAQAIESLHYMFKAQLTPFFWGHAGIGKTSIMKQYAKKHGYKFFAFYLGTQSDVGDILGLAEFIENADKSKSTSFATPKWLSDTIRYCNENPQSGAVIFLDEFNRGRRDILAGMFSLALDKAFHTIQLPKNCHIVAAGNPPTDEYFTTDVDETALMARFVHVKLEPTFDEWLKYSEANNMNSTITGFLKQQPELLEAKRSNFELPVKVDRRAWERLDRLFAIGTPAHLMENLMIGIIGLERTVAYQNYMKSVDKPLSGNEVLAGKGMDKVAVWTDPSNVLSSLLNLTCDNVKEELLKREENLSAKEKKALYAFLQAVPMEFFYNLTCNIVKIDNKVFKDFFLDKKYEAGMLEMMKLAKGKIEVKDDKATVPA